MLFSTLASNNLYILLSRITTGCGSMLHIYKWTCFPINCLVCSGRILRCFCDEQSVLEIFSSRVVYVRGFRDRPFVYFSAADGLRAVFRDLPNRQLAIALFYYQLSLRRSWVNIIHRLPIADWHEVKHIVPDEVIESFQVCIPSSVLSISFCALIVVSK